VCREAVTLASTVQKVSSAQWRILILLVLSVWINYMDRANLSVAAPQLRADLSLSPLQLGMLLSAFFWTYSALQPVAGWLVDRFNVGWVFAIGYFLWSVATGITGLVSGLPMLLACRLILGLGESIAYPAYSNILANHFPQHRLALANALIDAGSKMGPALGTLLGALLVESLGWRIFFIALGLIGGAWLIPWAFWAPRSTTRLTKVMHSSASPSYFEIMRVRAIWGTSIAHFGGNYFWYFLITCRGPRVQLAEDGLARCAAVRDDRDFLDHGGLVFRPADSTWPLCLESPALDRRNGAGRIGGRHSGAAPAKRVAGHGGALRRGSLLRPVLIQLVGHYANTRRTHRRGPMVGVSELLWQHVRSRRALADGFRGFADRRVLLGLRRLLRGAGDRGVLVHLRGAKSGAHSLVHGSDMM
jgi:hypothetical protein